jgi:ABC-type transporter lipoprotein component MlaA
VVVRAATTVRTRCRGKVEVFKVSEGLDKALIGPAARAYGKRVPGPLRSGLRNFLNNLREPMCSPTSCCS